MQLRLSARVLSIALLTAAAACDNKVAPRDPAADVVAIQLNVSGTTQQTITARASGTTGTIQLVQGQPRAFSAVFLDANNQVVAGIEPAEFRLDVTPSAGVTFSRTGAFAGTLTAASGTTTGSVQVSLFHIPANHAEVGPFTVNVIASSQ